VIAHVCPRHSRKPKGGGFIISLVTATFLLGCVASSREAALSHDSASVCRSPRSMSDVSVTHVDHAAATGYGKPGGRHDASSDRPIEKSPHITLGSPDSRVAVKIWLERSRATEVKKAWENVVAQCERKTLSITADDVDNTITVTGPWSDVMKFVGCREHSQR